MDYPQRFGKYVLLKSLARGGMGQLHLGISGRADLRKRCVIKHVIVGVDDDEYQKRFADEAALVVRISHGNIVHILEAGVENGAYFLAMEYVEGCDLRALTRAIGLERPALPQALALHIGRELCRGLHHAHTFQGLSLVHRDVSPPNVLISEAGEVKITDFGLAQSRLKLQKTAPGVVFGKPGYMSPEQARGDELDGRSDIYSAAMIIWELLTGERYLPRGGTQFQKLSRAAGAEYRSPSRPAALADETPIDPAIDTVLKTRARTRIASSAIQLPRRSRVS